MNIVQLVIDDKPISAPEGTNVFHAAMNNGIYIPGLCYHPKLSQFGGCRLCFVEITERKRTGHRFACAHPVSEGMVVKVNTPRVVRYRKSVMEYLLAHHELSCPTCDKSGECGLQNITYELNLAPGRFRTVRMHYPVIRDNPVLELNRNRCVLCGRCVSTCKEIEGLSAIDFQNRGFKTVVGTAFDRPLECSFCGGCVAVCPTGAWQDRTLGFRGRAWEFTSTPTICPYCSVGCTVVVDTKAGNVRRIVSNDRLGINEGNLCVKGRFGHEFIHSPERLKTPLIRRNGEFSPATWNDALDYVSKRFQEIIQKYGGTSIGGIGSERCTNEDNYLFQKFCRAVLGTNVIDNISNMKSPYLNRLIYQSVVNGIATPFLRELEQANTLFFFGADVTEAHPVIGSMARKAIRLNNANLVIANVRDVQFNSNAKNDIRLFYTLGSQIILINALMKVIIEEGLVDEKKAEVATNHFHELCSALNMVTVSEASQQTGVPEETIRNAARILAKPGRCHIICGKDIEEDPSGEVAVKALLNLCALLNILGNNEDKRASVLFSRSHNNSQGVNDMGVVPEFLPGYLDLNDASHRERVKKIWGRKLPEHVVKEDSVNVIDLMLNGKVKALYVIGENPVMTYPYGKDVREACKKLDFLVVQDAFLTETAQMADVVLPTAIFAEKEGTFTNMGMTVQRLNRALQPAGEARQDWEILCELAKKMGYSFSYLSVKEVLQEIGSLSPIYAGIQYDRLKRKEFRWISSFYDKNPRAPYTFEIIRPPSAAIVKRKDFPYLLLTGASLNHHGSFSRHAKALIAIAPECFVEISRKVAQDAGILNGDTVTIESLQNKIKLKVKVTDRIPEGIVFIPEDYEWVPVNLLRNKIYTPVKIYKETE